MKKKTTTKGEVKPKSLQDLIDSRKFTYINSNINVENFPPESIRSSEYKVFNFSRYITSEDAVKEMERDGYTPANIYELLSWQEWNGTDWVVALGSSCLVRGPRHVPYLYRWHSKRGLDLSWWHGEWRGHYRFLAVRNSSSTLETKNSALGNLEAKTLCPHCGKGFELVIQKV